MRPCVGYCGLDRVLRQFRRGLWHSLGGALLLVLHPPAHLQGSDANGAQTAVPGALRLGLPIDCTLGQNCFILAYVDALPGPQFEDFGGGRQTYDGHDGTDFGIASEHAMLQGVAVKAAAAGVVVRVRDGVADKRIANAQQASAISDIGCGNAVVIDHPAQWRTYYCHLRLMAPGSELAAQSQGMVQSPNRINHISLIGKRNTPQHPLVAGLWRGHYQLRRGERLLIDSWRDMTVVQP